jgi:hypothetical protein
MNATFGSPMKNAQTSQFLNDNFFRFAVVSFTAILLSCVNNTADNNYGPVESAFLTTLTWQQTDNPTQPISVGKFFIVSPNDSTLWNWEWFDCKSSTCDTCFRDDTSHETQAVHFYGDTVVFLNNLMSGGIFPSMANSVITKLDENNLVLKFINLSEPVFSHYQRSHRVLVKRGTGANAGQDTVVYCE